MNPLNKYDNKCFEFFCNNLIKPYRNWIKFTKLNPLLTSIIGKQLIGKDLRK